MNKLIEQAVLSIDKIKNQAFPTVISSRADCPSTDGT